MPWNDRVKRRLKLRDLDILMAVVQTGSMGNAARSLNMSQPAVSKAVADLEFATGVRLLDRSRRGVEPTAYGLALLKRGVAVFDELRHGIQDIDFLIDPTAGDLRVGATEPIVSGIVAPVIERLSRQNPRMTFRVISGEPTMFYRELTERNIELAIARMFERAPSGEDIETEIIFDDSVVIAAGANNPWTRRRKIELAELVNEPWLLLPFESLLGSTVVEAFIARGLAPPRPTVSSQSVNLLNELVATGRFLTVVPGFSLKFPRKHPSLRALSVELPNARRPIAIFTLKNRTLSPLAQLFCERVRALTKPLAKF
jgi:DNA-binding transcriptional LysR family regulator